MKSKRYEDDHNLTLEELILLLENAEDRLKENALDARALSDYNRYFNIVQRLETT